MLHQGLADSHAHAAQTQAAASSQPRSFQPSHDIAHREEQTSDSMLTARLKQRIACHVTPMQSGSVAAAVQDRRPIGERTHRMLVRAKQHRGLPRRIR